MTATTLSRPLLLAGSTIAASLGRAGQWTLAHYMRAPLASTGLLAMVTFTALAASNALYFQTARHPAPFFAPAMDMPVPVTDAAIAPEPMPLLTREVAVQPVVTQETTGSVANPVLPASPVGNPEAYAVQKKLFELGLFTGKVDGFYGPMTANAIRAFEQRNGMTPTGALTPGVINAILRADSSGRAPLAQVAPTPAPAPVVVQQAVVAPQPVQAMQPVQQQDEVVARLPTLTPVDHAVDTIGTAAAQTLDSIVAAVDGSRSSPAANAQTIQPLQMMASSSQPMPAAVQQIAALDTQAPQPVSAVQNAPVPDLASSNVLPANNVQLVSSIQRGLASLGFYHGSIDGHPGDATARAIREFENFHSYRVTGQINPDLVGLLQQAGASI